MIKFNKKIILKINIKKKKIITILNKIKINKKFYI